MPQVAEGIFDYNGVAGIRTDVASALVRDLEASDPADETGAQDLVASYVGPVSVLRRTVQVWADSEATCLLRRATADNLLILLDVDHLADCSPALRYVHSRRIACFSGTLERRLSSSVVRTSLACDLPDPSGPVSMWLRDARAHASWLEACCGKLALFLSASSETRGASKPLAACSRVHTAGRFRCGFSQGLITGLPLLFHSFLEANSYARRAPEPGSTAVN